MHFPLFLLSKNEKFHSLLIWFNQRLTVDQYIPQMPVHTQPTLIASIDGNVELHEAQPTTIGTNKIIINITKNVHSNKNPINSGESIDNNLEINDKEIGKNSNSNDTDQYENGGNSTITNNGNPTNVTNNKNAGSNNADSAQSITEIEYEVKDSIKHVQFKKQPAVHSGLETSGLCSIM